MNLIPEILDLQGEFEKIRHQIHENPELGFDELCTAKLVAQKLKEFGYEVYEEIGKTGVVGVLKKGNSDKKNRTSCRYGCFAFARMHKFAL